MTPVRIVGVNFSNYVQSVLLALREKGVPYELVPLASAPSDPAHRVLHPWGKIPVALLDDGPLYETTAILRWIDGCLPGPALMPTDPLAAARAEQWMSALNCYLDLHFIRRIAVPGLQAHRRGETFTPSDELLADVDTDLAAFDTALGTAAFFGGETPILPDFLMAPMINYVALSTAARPLLYRRPALVHFLAAVHARPSSEGILKKPT